MRVLGVNINQSAVWSMIFKYGLPHLYLPTPYIHTASVEKGRDPFLLLLFHTLTLQDILQTAMVPILLLVLPSLSLGQTQCGPYTMKDVEGPFFEVCQFSILAFTKVVAQPNAPKDKELAPRNELNDRSQFVILKGQVGEDY